MQILDAFVTTLTLDPSGYKKGQAEAARSIKQTKEGALGAAKDIEAAGKRAGSFFASLKTQVVGTLLAFEGTSGVISFISDITKANAGIGRLSANLDMAPARIGAWQSAFQAMGGSAADADGILRKLKGNFENFKLTHQLENSGEFMAMGVRPDELKNPEDAMLALAENRMGLTRTAFANMLTRMGFTEAGIALLAQGRDKLAAFIDEQERLNPITEENVKAAQDFEKALAKLRTTLVGLTQGPLTDFINLLTRLLEAAGGKNTFKEGSVGWEVVNDIQHVGAALGINDKPGRSSGGYKLKPGERVVPAQGGTGTIKNNIKPKPKGSSRGERNNNPGNLEASAWTRGQPGYKGSDGRFAIFDTMANGTRAQEKLISNRYLSRGFDTPNKLINRYGNDPGTQDDAAVANYKRYVANRLGIGVNDRIAPNRVAQLAAAMREFETGNRPGGRAVRTASSTVRGAQRSMPGQRGGNGSTVINTTNVGTITVHTAGTDGKSIARDLPGAIKQRGLTTQANRGMQ